MAIFVEEKNSNTSQLLEKLLFLNPEGDCDTNKSGSREVEQHTSAKVKESIRLG